MNQSNSCESQNTIFIHGNNIEEKINGSGVNKKYKDPTSQKYLKDIKERYLKWKNDNLALKGPGLHPSDNEDDIIEQRTQLFNDYKDFIEQPLYAEHFDSRSNLQSSVLEEFFYYLFNDLVQEFSKDALIGKSHAFKDIFFRGDSYSKMVKNPKILIEKKDHDFVIGVAINSSFTARGQKKGHNEIIEIPVVAIECKTYMDKTMLEGISNAGEQLIARNPNALYLVAAERIKLAEDVNLRKYKIDQIYVLRKEKNVDREYRLLDDFNGNPIFSDTIKKIFNDVRDHLSKEWHSSISEGIERGYLIND